MCFLVFNTKWEIPDAYKSYSGAHILNDNILGFFQEILSFVKMILMLKPFSVLPLVGIDSITGPSSMRKILNGGGPHAFPVMGNHGTGDVEVKVTMTLHLSLIVRIQI